MTNPTLTAEEIKDICNEMLDSLIPSSGTNVPDWHDKRTRDIVVNLMASAYVMGRMTGILECDADKIFKEDN